MRITVIGPFPNPITGCSLANKVLSENLERKGVIVNKIDTKSEQLVSNKFGEFSFRKIFSFFKVYFNILSISNSELVYSTPGQTFFGILKYSPFYLYCIFFKIPYLIHLHGNFLGEEFSHLKGIKKSLFKYFISNASVGIVLSESLQANFNQLLSPSKIRVVYNFAEDTFFKTDLELKNKIPTILFLSNLMEEKGILDFLDALILLKKSKIQFEAHIAGQVEPSIENVINEKLSKLGKNVIFHNSVHGVTKTRLLTMSNIFILPTYYRMEGQPIAILEALATGNIILTTKHAGINDIISDRNGFWIDKRNASKITDTLLNIIPLLDFYIAEKGLPNREYAFSRFTEKLFTEQLFLIFNEVARIK
ncbi:glycosyltransferase family 4 protein [Flectobacillus sp. BAB-3569]|uniref:glycosyltransferase family 4 protein n=1 Tax=Flectobacillus sp. BAB-3569 TaxID=1509483 RepID=UPI000BA2BCC7|nr:glycosyltransferase family 4 protein [Flectobacillus sp. BAB-3569]PAC30624.1 hypothetical protein BWI92_11350 [Flectobacillus sp. BAB-3569]